MPCILKIAIVEFAGGEALLRPDLGEITECAEFSALGLITRGAQGEQQQAVYRHAEELEGPCL